ncbi:MAG: hypothetical protein R2814_14420 [Flavobacteriaceae bacterium]
MKKTTLLLVALLITCSSIYSQKIVQSKEISIAEPQIQALEASFEKYRLIEIDIPGFKENVSSLKESRILWKIDSSTEYDMKIHPEEIRSPDFQASIVSENRSSMLEKSEIVTYNRVFAKWRFRAVDH